ncbi:ankyrin repeat domain-containing protein [Micromonospora cathayae]|uniref:Ankyrin repeat domain-containing protein n=1 Tax=Micromonospora cathayae TaxID=3028804 RepID=A0ABY7ZIG1_9ACTN|nr:ankyrin repeat domain-containing protein [Micromonospora sp. HUAS 3]WDZ82775.1 ankyrin repeat domain-containing protein [Micromonospora sp. HUAS 3]
MAGSDDVPVLADEDPVAVAVVRAIRTGDLATLRRLLAADPDLVHARIGVPDGRPGSAVSRTLLHVAADWPGHYPNGAATVAVLVAAGADVDARAVGAHTETPLHWAASSGDVEVLDALLDAGADIDAAGAVVGGGTPLDDATAFAQWRTAHRLVERGAHPTLWHAATLGLLDRLRADLARPHPPDPAEVSAALWGACHGGQQRAAGYLLDHGADLNWIPAWEPLTPLDAATRSGAVALADWLRARGARSAAGSTP